MICDRHVVGIQDTVLSQQLQLDARLTLEIANKRIQQREAVSEQHQILNGAKKTQSDYKNFKNLTIG